MASTLHMLCGKIASGKSTLAHQLVRDGGVLVAEDEWLGALFGEQMKTGADYMRCAGKLRSIMAPHLVSLLNAGTSIVLDFPANTVGQRGWMREILAGTTADHQMHVLDTPDEDCLARLAKRNAAGDHPFAVTEDQFWQFSKHFSPPTADEGFNLILHHPRRA
ncbi:ATP-binding protein [Phaeobacter sp. J2-8]|uniref:AAA family ATPase n=1 Tax=Phaeobacter sp. J2-8 TaxID=2931394 RepID=UPI001FD16CF9|nr:ATP-binding protein [Phaeobacter sp. J2-8]MCJ7872024.1 ATP-binding protein [Phaeobacter sp. J2-8]